VREVAYRVRRGRRASIHPTTTQMGSKLSKAKRHTSVGAKTVVAPRVSQEITDEILNQLAIDPDVTPLRMCARVSKSWVILCRRHLFHTILFTSGSMARWLETFPVPKKSPAHYVRDLHFSLGWPSNAPRGFSEHTPWFTNVEAMTLSEQGGFLPSWIPSLGRLPRSVTSLTINVATVSLARVRDVLVQLPKLDDLWMSGSLVVPDVYPLAGIGAVLRGRFRGQLCLFNGHADEDVMNMLLEVPTGLHFIQMCICGTHESFLSTVRLVEACGKTLVQLRYTLFIHGKFCPFSQSSRF
jgi:hypothetical protein